MKTFKTTPITRTLVFALALSLSNIGFAAPELPLSLKTNIPPSLASKDSILMCDKGVVYTPVSPFDAATYTDSVTESGVTTEKQMSWPSSTAEINGKLPNISTEIGVTTMSAGGVIAGLFGVDKTTQSIVIDFIKYRSEPLTYVNGVAVTTLTFARVGVGMRLYIDLSKAQVNFAGSLMALAASVKAGTSIGTISAEVMGIDSPDVTQAMPFTSDLSEASIQRVIEAMAIVKSRLSDEKTKLRPQLLARMSCKQ